MRLKELKIGELYFYGPTQSPAIYIGVEHPELKIEPMGANWVQRWGFIFKDGEKHWIGDYNVQRCIKELKQ